MKPWRLSLLAAFLLLFGAGIIIVHCTSEPTFKGRTAREWFNARARKEIDEEQFSLAVAALHSNFHSVLIDIPSLDAHGRDSKWSGMSKELLIWFNTEVLRRIDDHAFQMTAFEVTSCFYSLPNRDMKLQRLTVELPKADLRTQFWILRHIFLTATGIDARQADCPIDQLRHQDFLIRLYAAWIISGNSRPPRPDADLAVPILMNVLTNEADLIKHFGSNSRQIKEIIQRRLNRTSRSKPP